MAVNRPNFSKKDDKLASRVVEKRAVPVLKKQKKVSSKKRHYKGLRTLVYLFLVGFLFLESGWPPGNGIKKLSAQTEIREEEENLPERSGDRTTVLGTVGLTNSQMREVAKNILYVANAMTDEFYVADGLTLAMYILRYFAEIGEYELAHKDIMILVNAFEKLTGRTIGEEVHSILEQIRKIRFGKREGKYFSQFFAQNPVKGIVINIDQVSEDPNSSLRRIDRVKILDGATLDFDEIDTSSEKKEVREFIKTPIKILGVIDADSIRDALYQIHPAIIDTIDDYLVVADGQIPALKIGMQGIDVRVETSTIFKDITFDFQKAYAFPSMKNEQGNIPTFVLGGKAKLLNLKVSIDQ